LEPKALVPDDAKEAYGHGSAPSIGARAAALAKVQSDIENPEKSLTECEHLRARRVRGDKIMNELGRLTGTGRTKRQVENGL